MRPGFALLLLTSLAAADPRPAAKPDPSVLAQGQKLGAAGKHKEAIAQYEKYLALDPDNVTANAELGWSAFQLKDYAKAEAATRRAIKNGKDPGYHNDPDGKPKGAALYNLALILDAQGKRADAATALVDSLAARPNKVVREKLLELDAAKAAAIDPLLPVKMTATKGGPRDGCDDCEPTSTKAKPVLATPFEAVELEYKWGTAILAVKTAGAWYRIELDGPVPCGAREAELTKATVATRGTRKVLEVEYRADGWCSWRSGGREHAYTVKTRNVVVFGLGPSKVPSVTQPISTSLDAEITDDDIAREPIRSRGTVGWSGDWIEVAGRFEAVHYASGELTTDDLAGKHALAFP